MKTLLAAIALTSTLIATTPVFANDFSSDFVNDKITKHWELDTLEITQRIDVKKRREMKQKSAAASEKKLQALQKLMQQSGSAEVDEDTITGMLSHFAQPDQDAEMIVMDGSEDMAFPDPNELMLTDMSDYETSMMIEEAFTLQANGGVIYPDADAETAKGTIQSTEETADSNTGASWSFDVEKQLLS